MTKIAVLWPFLRVAFFIDYPELQERQRDIIFIHDKEDLQRLRGLWDIQYIYPDKAWLIETDTRIQFVEIIKMYNFQEYDRKEASHDKNPDR